MLDAGLDHETLAGTLVEIARRYGTPCYAYDLRRLAAQAEKIRTHLPNDVRIYYSLKANASLGICEVLRRLGLGADVASAGELATALEAGVPADSIFVAGPYKSAETRDWLYRNPSAIVSVDSPSELRQLSELGLTNLAVLRLRPNFSSHATVAAGADSRFGFLLEQLELLRIEVRTSSLRVVGFHVFAGSQVLSADCVAEHLRGAFQLAHRAAQLLGIDVKFLDLGGGFGIPYRAQEPELDLSAVGAVLRELTSQAPSVQLALELGRFFVAQAGYYLTRVVGEQLHGGRRAVIVDGGSHQRADLCGLCLRTKAAPPLVMSAETGAPLPRGDVAPTDVLGCLSLPADVMAESAQLPAMCVGDILAFRNAGAYGQWASAVNFHGYTLPAEIAFDGKRLHVMRESQSTSQILIGQRHIPSTADESKRTPLTQPVIDFSEKSPADAPRIHRTN